MISQSFKNILKGIPVIAMTGIFFYSCTNDLEEVKTISDTDLVPTRITYNGEYIFTDSALIKNKLNSSQFAVYETADSTYTVLSNGFKLTFFDEEENVDGVLTAKNGYINQDYSKMLARDSVIFVNREGERLRTEELYWLQDSNLVYTDKFVIIEKKDAIINGQGLVSNQNFTDYRIKQPTGIIYLNENEEE